MTTHDPDTPQESLRLGTPTPYGKVLAVGWVGERYYWTANAQGTVSMIPAYMVER